MAPVALIVWGAILFPVVTGIYGLVKWRGTWRTAAAVPLAILVLFFVLLIFDWSGDPTGRLMWGLIFIPLAMILSTYSGVVALLHRKRVSGASGEPLLPNGPQSGPPR